MEDFDALKREATKLERHLEDRVARYQQLAQRIGNSTSQKNNDDLWKDPEAGRGGTSNNLLNLEEETMLRNDIQRTLRSLSDLIQTKLSPAAEQSGKSQHMLLVKRYREILFDLSSDFNKTSSTLQRKREQAELFSGANTQKGSDGTDPAMEQLLRERNSIQNSLNASNMVLNQAADIHGDLRNQGASLQASRSSLAKLTQNVPGLNQLVDAISKKRSRDDKIVAGTIAACIVFTLWYLFG